MVFGLVKGVRFGCVQNVGSLHTLVDKQCTEQLGLCKKVGLWLPLWFIKWAGRGGGAQNHHMQYLWVVSNPDKFEHSETEDKIITSVLIKLHKCNISVTFSRHATSNISIQHFSNLSWLSHICLQCWKSWPRSSAWSRALHPLATVLFLSVCYDDYDDNYYDENYFCNLWWWWHWQCFVVTSQVSVDLATMPVVGKG